jgi:signal peptidase II
MGRGTLILRRPGAVASLVLVGVVALDQATKALVRSTMELNSSIPLIGAVLRLTYVRNTGAAFGMMPGRPLVFMTVSVFVLVGIAGYWWRYRPDRIVPVIPLALVASGALGNLLDRAIFGRVTDFIEVPYWPVFNVADSCIFIGVTILVWWLLFGPVDAPEGAEVAPQGSRSPDAPGPRGAAEGG